MSGYTQLTQEKRYQIAALLAAGHSQAGTAQRLGCVNRYGLIPPRCPFFWGRGGGDDDAHGFTIDHAPQDLPPSGTGAPTIPSEDDLGARQRAHDLRGVPPDLFDA